MQHYIAYVPSGAEQPTRLLGVYPHHVYHGDEMDVVMSLKAKVIAVQEVRLVAMQ